MERDSKEVIGNYLKMNCTLQPPPPPPRIYVLKDALNHFLVHSSAKDSFRSAKNMVLSLFCILVPRLMGEGGGGQKYRWLVVTLLV